MSAIPHVLVIGYRRGLCQALKRLGVPYALWDASVAHATQALCCITQPIKANRQIIKQISALLKHYPPFTHVIAGTEQAVYPASVMRRELNARLSKHSVVLTCHDKLAMKQALQKKHVPMAHFIQPTPGITAQEVMARLGLPVVIKARGQSGGRGTFFCDDLNEINKHMGRHKLFEKFIDAPEASVESFIDQGEIKFTNITQYYEKRHCNIVPANFSSELTRQILQLNANVIKQLKLTWGITHLEVYLTHEGPLFGEIALRPPGGYLMALLKLAYGFDPWEALIAVELNRPFYFPAHYKQFAAVMVLHPGAGTVSVIKGEEWLSTYPAIQDYELKVRVGDVIQERQGAGQDVGHIVFLAPAYDELIDHLEHLKHNFCLSVTS